MQKKKWEEAEYEEDYDEESDEGEWEEEDDEDEEWNGEEFEDDKWGVEESEEEEEIDEGDLTQLPGVDMTLQRKLKSAGYDTLYEIAEATINELAEYAEVSKNAAKKMIEMANNLLGYEET